MIQNTDPSLWQAAKEGNVDKLDRVLNVEKNGLMINARNRLGYTPLEYAVYRGHVKATEVLLEHGADPTIADIMEKSTLLHHASHYGRNEIVQLLLARGVDVNCGDKVGNTALHEACHYGHQGVVHILLTHGADPTISRHDGKLPIELTTNSDIHRLLQLTSSPPSSHENEVSMGGLQYNDSYSFNNSVREASRSPANPWDFQQDHQGVDMSEDQHSHQNTNFQPTAAPQSLHVDLSSNSQYPHSSSRSPPTQNQQHQQLLDDQQRQEVYGQPSMVVAESKQRAAESSISSHRPDGLLFFKVKERGSPHFRRVVLHQRTIHDLRSRIQEKFLNRPIEKVLELPDILILDDDDVKYLSVGAELEVTFFA